MKRFLSLFAILASAALPLGAKDYTLASPSGDLKLTVSVDDSVSYSLTAGATRVLDGCGISMTLADGRVLGREARVHKVNRGSREETVTSPLYRQSSFDTKYNYLTLKMYGDWSLQFRAYNDGVSYRFVTTFPDRISVRDEQVEYNFASDFDIYLPIKSWETKDRYETSFENTYKKVKPGYMTDTLAFMPVLVCLPEGDGYALLMESNVEDYPGAFLATTPSGYKAEFSPIPEEYKPNRRGVARPVKYASDIAWTEGSRYFPWRIVGYAREAKDLAVNNMVYQTSSSCRLDDVSWITPGCSTWDWWNNFALWDVDFKSGINTATYKYHIDFAARFGIPYVTIDEGWYRNLNPLDVNPDVDLDYILGYARECGVKPVLWITGTLLWKDADNLCSVYSRKGAAGFKVDFFDAQNQETVKQVYDLAEVAARYNLILDLHGIYKPTGLSRAYPNVLNYEGVYGLEQLRGKTGMDMPRNDVLIPLIRMAAGQMDYTPGAMRNGGRRRWHNNNLEPQSQGTRAHQVALYVVLDQPFSMLCDSPSAYLEDTLTTAFITSIPSVVDRTVPLDARLGEYFVTMREKDGRFYVGGITDWTARDLEVPLGFLPAGEHRATLYRDGANADKVGRDHVIETLSVCDTTVLRVHLAEGGGFALQIDK